MKKRPCKKQPLRELSGQKEKGKVFLSVHLEMTTHKPGAVLLLLFHTHLCLHLCRLVTHFHPHLSLGLCNPTLSTSTLIVVLKQGRGTVQPLPNSAE